MKKTTIATIPSTSIGLDLSDRTFQFCELNAADEIVDEGQLRLNQNGSSVLLMQLPKQFMWECFKLWERWRLPPRNSAARSDILILDRITREAIDFGWWFALSKSRRVRSATKCLDPECLSSYG